MPEVNPEAAKKHQGIIANPNCSTIIMNVAVYPLYKAAGVTRCVISTYQAASGAGAAAMEELEQQVQQQDKRKKCAWRSGAGIESSRGRGAESVYRHANRNSRLQEN